MLHGENFRAKMQNQVPAGQRNAATPYRAQLYRPPSATPVVPNNAAQVAQQNIINNNKEMFRPFRPSTPRRASPGPAQLQKSIEAKKPAAAAQPVKRPVSAASKDVVEIERKMSYLEQMRKKQAYEEALLQKKKQELIEKQKNMNYMKGRENGWQNILPVEDEAPSKPRAPVIANGSPYARYHQQLDALEARNKPVIEQQDAIYKQIANNNRVIPRTPSANSNSSNKPPVAVIRNEFVKRREEFEKNRMRGKGAGNILGQGNLLPKPPPAYLKKKDELEEQLRRIRLQNLQNRKQWNKEIDSVVNRSQAEENKARKLAALRVRFSLFGLILDNLMFL